MWVLEEYPIVDFLVLPGYHLYKMDFQELLKVHCDNKADITVAVLSRKRDNNDIALGTFQVNSESQVISFKDNPEMRVVSFSFSFSAYFQLFLIISFSGAEFRHFSTKVCRYGYICC